MLNGISGFSDYKLWGSMPVGNANGPSTTDSAFGVDSGKVNSSGECETCSSRKYQDGSNENVSFKAATHISPEAAASAVRAHEGEHVSNAYTKAAQNNGKVINASVSIHTSVCPECGRTYVSGGLTSTTIKYFNEDNPYIKNQKANQADALKGMHINFAT